MPAFARCVSGSGRLPGARTNTRQSYRGRSVWAFARAAGTRRQTDGTRDDPVWAFCKQEPLVIDFRDLSASGAIIDGKIAGLRVNDVAVTPEQANGHILIAPASLRIGTNKIELDFESAIASSNRAVTRTIDPLDSSEYLYTLFVPMDASLAFPCFDQPDLKARFTLEATAPAGLDRHFEHPRKLRQRAISISKKRSQSAPICSPSPPDRSNNCPHRPRKPRRAIAVIRS